VFQQCDGKAGYSLAARPAAFPRQPCFSRNMPPAQRISAFGGADPAACSQRGKPIVSLTNMSGYVCMEKPTEF
jgi:hypothetical protein